MRFFKPNKPNLCPVSIIIKTIPKIKFEGRVQYIKKGKLRKLLNKNEKILIDGCHSKESAKNLYNYLKTINGPIYGIWGMQKNKLPDAFIESFNLIFKKLYTVAIPDEPNAIKAPDLKSIGLKLGYNTQNFSSVENVLKKISDKRKKTIVIFGSLYLVGNILSKN